MITPSRVAGWLCLLGSGIGVLQGLVLLLYPPVVGLDRYSYPFTSTGYVIAQASFAVQHLLLLVGLVTLARAQAGSALRLTRFGLWVGVAGMVGLTAMEVVAMTAADVATDSSQAALVSSLYGIPTMIIGGGLVAGGIGFARSGRLPSGETATGWRRWVPLIIGGYVFVPLLPAIMAPFVVGRFAIMGWMITFAALGWMLIRPGNRQPSLDKISSRTFAASA
jgi:hypothetical protein